MEKKGSQEDEKFLSDKEIGAGDLGPGHRALSLIGIKGPHTTCITDIVPLIISAP